MVEVGVIAELVECADGSHFGIEAAEDEAGDSGVDCGAGAHGAWL